MESGVKSLGRIRRSSGRIHRDGPVRTIPARMDPIARHSPHGRRVRRVHHATAGAHRRALDRAVANKQRHPSGPRRPTRLPASGGFSTSIKSKLHGIVLRGRIRMLFHTSSGSAPESGRGIRPAHDARHTTHGARCSICFTACSSAAVRPPSLIKLVLEFA